MSKEKTGASVKYYGVHIEKPIAGGPPVYVECTDIAEALGLTPLEYSIFKALWRIAAARNGLEKEDNTALYDAEKIEFCGNALLAKHTPRVVAEPMPSAGWQGWWYCKDSTVKQAHYFNASRHALCGAYPEIGHLRGMCEAGPESVRDGVGFCKDCSATRKATTPPKVKPTPRAWDGWFYNSEAIGGYHQQHHFKNSGTAVCGYKPSVGDEMIEPPPWSPNPARCTTCNVMPMAPRAPEPGEATNFIPGQ